MKHIYFKCFKAACALSLALLSGNASAQNPTSQDNASNYEMGEFIPGSAAGSGFVPWQFISETTPTSGYAISSSVAAGMGNVDTDGKAFMLYAYGDTGISLVRYFRGTGSIADPGDARSVLLPGQVFSIEVAVGNRNGYKGIDILSNDQSDRLATLAIDAGHYRFGDMDNMNEIDNSINESFPYDLQSIFIIQAHQLTSGVTPFDPGTYEITLTRNNVTVSTGVMIGNIGGFKVYNGGTSSDDPLNRIYFNNPRIERRCPDSTTWNGTEWSNGTPDLTKTAVIASGTLTVSEDMQMCTLYVNNAAEVIVESGVNLTVANVINIASTASMVVENNANLIQIDNVQNTGNITVHRNSSPIKRLDYTLWSSPVTGQNLFEFSPETLPNRFYTYDSTDNLYSAIPGLGDESETIFEKGRGYLIRAANNHPDVPTVWNGEFEGLPNSGTVSVPLNTSNDPALRYTLVGNPYPSAISIEEFVKRNSLNINGQLWFWRKTNNPETSSYCTVMADGDYVGNGALEDSEAFDPQGVIRTGQGFFVQASSSSPANIIFNNSLREADNSNRFFRNAMDNQPENNRFWLNIAKGNNFFGQTLVNYRTGATMDIDYGMDGKARVNEGSVKLYTVEGQNTLAIQARSLPFSSEDVVKLGFRTEETGTLTIVLDKYDGLFATQNIYLEDTYLGVTQNIKNSGYEFVTEQGTFNDRFRIVYAESLNTTIPEIAANNVIVYKQGNALNINAGKTNLKSVELFDVRGRMLFAADGINAAETSITSIQPQQQFLIINAVTENGVKISKKVIF